MRDTYYCENVCKSSAPERDIDRLVSPLPRRLTLFRPASFYVQSCRAASTSSSLPPSLFPAVRSPFPVPTAASRRHRVYGTYGGRYVLWLIVLLSLTYFQFTAAARCFASWLSIVRDERRFMCHPGYSRPTPVAGSRFACLERR